MSEGFNRLQRSFFGDPFTTFDQMFGRWVPRSGIMIGDTGKMFRNVEMITIERAQPGMAERLNRPFIKMLQDPLCYAKAMKEFFPKHKEKVMIIADADDRLQEYYDALEWHSGGPRAMVLMAKADAIHSLKLTERHTLYAFTSVHCGEENESYAIGLVGKTQPTIGKQKTPISSNLRYPPYIYGEYRRTIQGRQFVSRALRCQVLQLAHEDSTGRSEKEDVFLEKRSGVLRFRQKARTRMKAGGLIDEVYNLCDRQTPEAVVVEKNSRTKLKRFLSLPIVITTDATRGVIQHAIEEAELLTSPIMPPTDFELVAYADERDALRALPKPAKVVTREGVVAKFTPSRSYKTNTGVYTFTETFDRTKLAVDEATKKSTTVKHKIVRTGEDRLMRIIDDNQSVFAFCDRPKSVHHGVEESQLWEVFERPQVKTVKEAYPKRYKRNQRVMTLLEIIGRFNYYQGQRDYYARIGCRDSALIAGEVGTGKTLGALSLIAMQSPRRTLIMAPQGTMRTQSGEVEDFDNAAQWVQEIHRFAPTEPVFRLFSLADYEKICSLHNGSLPEGLYISYPQAMFSNSSFEHLPRSWTPLAAREKEERFRKQLRKYLFKDGLDEPYCAGVGHISPRMPTAGIKCVAIPNLATRIGDVWDMVILDEGHLIANLSTFITRNFIRIRAKYRYVMTATPIPNVVSDIFPLMGWLSVADWFLDDKRNAAWPYAIKNFNGFAKVFMAQERDKTQEIMNRLAGRKNTRCVRPSAIISSPARLLKLLKPTLAFIDKLSCNPNMVSCSVRDVRVPMGKEQAELYKAVLDPSSLPYRSALTRARVHNQLLRGVCAHPTTVSFNDGIVSSDFNPKTATILEVIAKELADSNQVLVSCARLGQTDEIERRLIEAGVRASRIDGTIPAGRHATEANAFKRGETEVMLMGIKCAQGHDFGQCPRMIIASIEWGYGVLHQAEGRIYRLNSAKAVEITVILNQNSIEETIFDRVAQKQDAATICLHGQRVPHNLVQYDADDILASHVVNWNEGNGKIKAEAQCEAEWPALKAELVKAVNKMRKDKNV